MYRVGCSYFAGFLEDVFKASNSELGECLKSENFKGNVYGQVVLSSVEKSW